MDKLIIAAACAVLLSTPLSGQTATQVNAAKETKKNHVADFEKLIQQGIEESKEMTEEERRQREWGILTNAVSLNNGLRGLGIRQNDLTLWFVLGNLPTDMRYADHEDNVQKRLALREILERYASGNSDRAADWARLLAAFHLYTGDVGQARVAFRAATSRGGAASQSYDQVFGAYLDRINGDAEALQRLFAKCPPPAPSHVERFGKPENAVDYCTFTVESINVRVVKRLGKESPPGVGEVFVDLAHRRTVEDPQRILSINALRAVNRTLAEREYQTILAQAKDPAQQRLALAALLGLAKDEGKWPKAIEYADRLLKDLGHVPQRAGAADWKKLVGTPLAKATAEDDVLFVLTERVVAAQSANDEAFARIAFEQLLHHAVGNGATHTVIENLWNYAVTLYSRGQKDAAARIYAYVLNFDDPDFASRRNMIGVDTGAPRATSPW